MGRNPREGSPSPPARAPPDTIGVVRGFLNYTHFVIFKLSLFMVYKLKATGLTETLEGLEPKGYLEWVCVDETSC